MSGIAIELGALGSNIDQYYFSLYFVPEYRSPDKSIWAYIKQVEQETIFTDGGIYVASLRAGKNYLDIHFTPDNLPNTTDPADPANVRHILAVGFPAYFHFLQSLETDRILRDINVIVGTTNERMADFAVKYLSFRPIDKFDRHDDLLKEAKDYENGLEKPSVNIYASRYNLLDRQAQLLHIWQRLRLG